MKLSRTDVIKMAEETGDIFDFAKACYQAGAEAEREGCAVTAWQHYMDTCYRLRIPASNNEHFNAAAAIRAMQRGDSQ